MSLDEAFNWAIKMHPNELQNMGWGWVNPLPQNGQELRKAFKDGAVGIKGNIKKDAEQKAARDKTDTNVQEARMMPIPSIMKLSKENRNRILTAIDWAKIRNDIVIPAIDKTEKTVGEIKDNFSTFMHKATNPSEKLIDETIANHFRKFGK